MSRPIIYGNMAFNLVFGAIQFAYGRPYWPQAILLAFFGFMLFMDIKRNRHQINFKRLKHKTVYVELKEVFYMGRHPLPLSFEAEAVDTIFGNIIFEVHVEFQGEYPRIALDSSEIKSIQIVKKKTPKELYSGFGGVK